MLTDFHFLRPLWLFGLPLLAAVLALVWRRRAGGSVWRTVVDPHLLPHLLVGAEGDAQRRPLVLLGAGGTLLLLALAGPVWERLPQPLFSTDGARVILLDLSPSMGAADFPPSRLARARFEILDLLGAIREGQVGLIAFGPEPFTVSPLTGDAKTIAAQVPDLSTDLIPVPGPRRTDLALESAAEMLERSRMPGGDLILVTDEVGDPAASLQVARKLAAAGHRLSVLAVGTAKGAPVPEPGGGFAKDARGGILMAGVGEARLRELARAGGGRYLAAEVSDADTKQLVGSGPRLGERVEKTALTADQWREEGPWLLLAVLPLAALGFRRGWLLPAVAAVLVLLAQPSQAIGWSDLWARPDQQAARQLESGDAAGAAERFADPAWRGAASYRAGDYQEALGALSDLKGSEADYNRGNALARLGRLKEAEAAYEQALTQDPSLSDARENLELVRKAQRTQQSQSEKSSQKEGADQKQPDDQGQDASESGQGGSAPKPEGAGDRTGAGTDEAKPRDSGPGDSQPSPSDQQGDREKLGGSTQSNSQGSSGDADSRQSDEASGQSGAKEPSDRAGGAPQGDPGAQFSEEALKPDAAPSERDPTKRDTMDAGAATAERAARSTSQTSGPPVAEVESLTPEEREQQEAMEAQLRRVPDDPAGLLRERFLLQHLRREGRLP